MSGVGFSGVGSGNQSTDNLDLQKCPHGPHCVLVERTHPAPHVACDTCLDRFLRDASGKPVRI